MAARFILSFDCEGKWGVADQFGGEHSRALTDDNLRAAYTDLLAILAEFDIPATFAFVGTFSLSADRLRDLRPGLGELAREAPGYLEHALADSARPGAEGWTGDWAVEAVATARPAHELALHGATHIPWNWPGLTADVARRELGLIFDAGASILPHVSTYIYPRNGVEHRTVLAEFGIAGTREARPASARLAMLLAEFDLGSAPELDPPLAAPLRIPAGYFVNWLSGPRRLIPPAVSRARARRMLDRASRTGGVVHYWTHPENLASAPAMLHLLRAMLLDVARLRDAGKCEVVTQEAYCRRVDPGQVADAAARRDARLALR